METWSVQWYWHEINPHITDEGNVLLAQLKSLEGAEFDCAFLKAMVKYDQDAIYLATPAAANSLHKEVRTMAQEIITEETTKIADMRQAISTCYPKLAN